MLVLGACFLGILSWCSADRSYRIKVEKFESHVTVNGLVGNASVKLTAFNETVTCITGFLELIGDIPPEALICVTGYERTREDQNVYQTKPTVNYSSNMCEFLQNDEYLMPALILRSNVDQTCMPRLKNYTIDCLNLESDSLPDPIPGDDHWQFWVFLYEKNSTLSNVMAYAMASVFFDSSQQKQQNAQIG